MRRFLLSVFAVLAALVLQLGVLDRLPLPGGVSPDLVLLVVVALALSNGPMAGLLTGFCAGLALDIAPPASHLIGLYALVLCLVGYCCGLVSAGLENSVLLPLGASALGAAGGAVLYAAAGVMLGNPDVSGQSVRHVLPLSVACDVLLSPFVLYAVALASRLTVRLAGSVTWPDDLAVAPGARSAGRQGAGLAGRLVRPGWLARPERSLRIPAAGPREGWIAGGGWLAASAELARSRPATVRLHLTGRGQAGLLQSARSAAGAPPASRATPRLRFGSGRHGLGSGWRGDGVAGGLFGRGVAGGSAGLAGITGGGLGTRLSRSGLGGGRSWVSGGRSWVSGRRSWLSGSRPLASGGARGRSWASAPDGRVSAAGRVSAPGRAPRKGTFSGGSARPGGHGGATPRSGVLRSPRRGTFGGSSSRGPLAGSSSRGPLARSPASGGPRRGTFGSGRHDPFSHARVRRKSPRRGSLSGGPTGAPWAARRRTLFGLPLPRRLRPGPFGGRRMGGWR